ncbi:hypothetical protein MBLNU230_g5826t1 [Neophaeotheca triangularis]
MKPFAADGDVARELSMVIQRDLIQKEIAPDENDMTMAEYIAAIIGEGSKTRDQVTQECSEFLPLDTEQLSQFFAWVYEQAGILQGAQEPTMDVASTAEVPVQLEAAPDAAAAVAPAETDVAMDDQENLSKMRAPDGPKSMRNSGRGGIEAGRGKRVMNQLHKHMDRSQPAGIAANRISNGRVDTKRGRQPPRGPASHGNNLAQGLSRTMQNMRGGFTPQMMQGGGGADPMQMAQFMETATAFMAQMANQQQQGQQTVYNPNFRGGRGGARGKNTTQRGRGGQRGGAHITKNGADAMDVSMDTPFDDQKDPFDTECRFNTHCTNPSCPYAHQSPAATGKTALDLSDTCPHKAACQNHKCSAKHPSPAQRTAHNASTPTAHTSSSAFPNPKSQTKCRFDTHCTRDGCPFAHSTIPPCKNGPDCDVRGCKFTHSEIPCRYDPCTKPGMCTFKHRPGQRKEGGSGDKVWTAEGGKNGTSERLKGFSAAEGEELILPGRNGGEGDNNVAPNGGGVGAQSESQDMETQIVT